MATIPVKDVDVKEMPLPVTPLFVIHYKTGYMMNQQHFRADDLPGAIQLAQEWCTIMNFKFINVAPFEVDLVKAIAYQKHKLASN